MRNMGYGSVELLRACEASAACRAIPGAGTRVALRKMRAGSIAVARYRRRLPVVDIALTSSPAGRMIDEHFAIREEGRWRYRDAQALLPLPAEPAEYLRGRHRQAVRTNVGHARRAGLVVQETTLDDWRPGVGDGRVPFISPGPIERRLVVDPDGVVVGDSILSVDEDVALLHGLVSYAPNARWLLHTAIVERLCGYCSVLLVNCDDVYRLDPGTQYFQRLLGYEIARLKVTKLPAPHATLTPAAALPAAALPAASRS